MKYLDNFRIVKTDPTHFFRAAHLQATRAHPTPKLAKEPQERPTRMTVTKKILFAATLILFLTDIFAQDKASYDLSFSEITKMLKGEEKLDFKRAVLLTENAFYSNKLDYKEFCKQIDNIEVQLNQFMRDKGVVTHVMGKQFAIFNYMMEPSKYNNNVRMAYDFEDLMGQKDRSKMFVTKLLKTKSGNCHSLPFLFKILAEEMRAEAYLALGPNHAYIKHKDDKGLWVNVELTNSSFPRDGWIISSLSITTEAIKKETYMEPLSLKESVAFCLYDLALGYKFQFGHDNFTLKCFNTVIGYFPKCIYAYMIKSEMLDEKRKALLKENGNQRNAEILKLENTITGLYDQIDSMGYKDMPKEQYERWAKQAEEERKKQQGKANSKNK
jgi:hypothetical protein